MSNVIRVEGLSKYYRLGSIGGGTLREDVNRWMAKLRGRPEDLLQIGEIDHGNRKGGQVWALKDVSFDVNEGEILGVIGRNGAGKSTLLKILSRITAPTQGRAIIKGRVGSLLEVGTGFHPELTGRENIYLNGAILGMKKLEVDRKLEEIVEFAELSQFIDTPAKRYSSGMTVRLAFAVAAHLDPEILIFDEVLAVGDAAFQEKCLGKMQDVAGTGRTIIFVSHNMGSVTQLCSRGIVIEQGSVAFDGDVTGAVERYLGADGHAPATLSRKSFRGHLLDQVVIEFLRINGLDLGGSIVLDPLAAISFEFGGYSRVTLSDFDLFLVLYRDGVRVATFHDSEPGMPLYEGVFNSKVIVPEEVLRPGVYTLRIGGERRGKGDWFVSDDVGRFVVMENWAEGYADRSIGLVNIKTRGERLRGE